MPRRTNDPATREFGVYLGRAIRAARRRVTTKAGTLGYDAGISQQNLSHIETGKTLPSFATLIALAKALGVPMWQVVRAAENAQLLNATMHADRDLRAAREQEDDEA